MVKPKDPYKITLQDLVNSCQGDTVTSILIDLNGFWTYENREVLVASDNDGSSTADLDDNWRLCGRRDAPSWKHWTLPVSQSLEKWMDWWKEERHSAFCSWLLCSCIEDVIHVFVFDLFLNKCFFKIPFLTMPTCFSFLCIIEMSFKWLSNSIESGYNGWLTVLLKLIYAMST